MALSRFPVRVGMFAAVVVGLIGAGCAEVPVHDVTKTFGVEVREISENNGPIKLDFLWIVDNSSSMCQEQYALAQSFGNFRKQLQTYLNIDIRLAVTNTDAINNKGKFVYKPATKFPLACIEAKPLACLAADDGGADDCTDKYGEGWRCVDAGDNAEDIYNYNGSVNSYCTYRCSGFGECCSQFCGDSFGDTCQSDPGCLDQKCESASDQCNFSCRQAGKLTSTGNGCVREPDTADCPTSTMGFLTNDTLEYFGCMAVVVDTNPDTQARMEQGLKSAWLALDKDGPNASQVGQFLRDDAYLVIAFVSDEDDCSIDDEYCSPAWTCQEDADCKGMGKCKLDYGLSYAYSNPTKTCCGSIRADHYNKCALLGDYKGKVHHELAYNLTLADCEMDEDCDDGWACKEVLPGRKKCRPSIFSLSTIAAYPIKKSDGTYQDLRTGAPVFSLTPVSEFYSLFRGLKSDPGKVLIAVITGDAQVRASDAESLISDACMANELLTKCQAYKSYKETADPACLVDPEAEACTEFAKMKTDCVRECYVASKGYAKNSDKAEYTHVCRSLFGQADFGSRYVKLAEMFGPNGMVSNICSEDGIAPALQTIAELIIKRVTKICLPLEPKPDQSIVVIRTIKVKDPQTGAETEVAERLVEGDDADYRIEYPTQDCCFPGASGDCEGTLKAITFNDVQDPSAKIEVRYEGTFDAPTE